MSYGRHRKPRWHDGPRAWLRTTLDRLCGRYEEVEDAPWCASPWCDVAPEPHPRQPDCPSGDHPDYVGFYPDEPLTDDHGNHIGEDLPDYEYDREPRVIRTAKVSGVHLPLSGEPVNPWAPCAFRQDVPRPDQAPIRGVGELTGPGHLTMWDIRPVPAPWKPRTWPVIVSGPRVCGGRIALLAGAA